MSIRVVSFYLGAAAVAIRVTGSSSAVTVVLQTLNKTKIETIRKVVIAMMLLIRYQDCYHIAI
jgi:hypothetical protein